MTTISTESTRGDSAEPFRWDVDAFLIADEAGVFDGRRVELVNGKIWEMTPIGDWHGDTVVALIGLLAGPGVQVKTSSLSIGRDSLPDPDVWVLRRGAVPAGGRGSKVMIWSPDDVELVVEVADTSERLDLGPKAALYASAGYRRYWVVGPDQIVVHADPGPQGYARTVVLGRADHLEYAEGQFEVADILGPN